MQLEPSIFIFSLLASGFFGGFIGFILTLVSLSRDKELQRVRPDEVVVKKAELDQFIAKSRKRRVGDVESSDFGMSQVEGL